MVQEIAQKLNIQLSQLQDDIQRVRRSDSLEAHEYDLLVHLEVALWVAKLEIAAIQRGCTALIPIN